MAEKTKKEKEIRDKDLGKVSGGTEYGQKGFGIKPKGQQDPDLPR
jgi:hypothetical protein